MTTLLTMLLLVSPPQKVDCIYAGVCCQMDWFKLRCGFNLHCRGKQDVTVVDGGVVLGECR
jgi:hypothetical protein